LVVEESWKCVEVEICWEWVAVSQEAVVRLLEQVETGILLNAVERAHQIWRWWDFTGGRGETTIHE
jgi:hypothetical protein